MVGIFKKDDGPKLSIGQKIAKGLRNSKTLGLAAMTIGLCFASYLLAQGSTPMGHTRFEDRLSAAHNDLSHRAFTKTLDGAGEAVTLSENAAGNRVYTRAVAVEAAARSYASDDPKAAIHLQILLAMQNQKVIEQNERIIKLLEIQASAKSK